MFRLYRYVGPKEIAEDARSQPMGRVIRSVDDLADAVSALGGVGSDGLLTVTFVIDALGELRVADRSSEHVACAGGGPVMTAGELSIVMRPTAVEEASNQSTGFCPESTSFGALGQALDAAKISHPGEWTAALEFRRCEACGARTLVKDDCFECAECEAVLPQRWNFDGTAIRRWIVRSSSRTWLLDSIEEPTGSGQDRVRARFGEDNLVLALADGAGGTSQGAEAADAAVDAMTSALLRGPDGAVAALRGIDAQLARQAGGETTAVVARVSLGEDAQAFGASVGDSAAWARVDGEWVELTEHQCRKPLVGSGRAGPVPFGPRRGLDALLIASDGLLDYAKWGEVVAACDAGGADLPWRLVDLARLPSGGLQDDLSALLLRRIE